METINKMEVENFYAVGISISAAILGTVIPVTHIPISDIEPFFPQTLKEWSAVMSYVVSIGAGIYAFFKKKQSRSNAKK